MQSTTDAIKILSSDFCQLVADGASNAIGSLVEHELQTRSTRESEVDFNVCMVHQNERSGGYASGTVKFALDPNPNLGAVLKKNHSLQVCTLFSFYFWLNQFVQMLTCAYIHRPE